MKAAKFIIRVLLLVVSVFIIAFGTALCIRSNIGCAPVSVVPYVWSSAGGMTVGGFRVPEWTVGTYTFILAVSEVTNSDFDRVKIIFDTTLVVIGIACMYIFFGTWHWNMIGIGTLISMVYVGYCVRLLNPLMGWLETRLY